MKFLGKPAVRGALAGLLWSAPLWAAGPIRLHPANPRYFEWNGRATVLVASGEHYGSVINPDFDFRRYLATIQAAGLNHTRLFLGDYVESDGSFGIVDNPLAPAAGRLLAPWARSSVPGYVRGGNKFDLDRWDPVYFARLHDFFDEASRRGIVVEAVLFFVGPGYDFSPLHPANNINGTTRIDGQRYLTLDSGNVLARQEAYARQLVHELNGYDNVIFNLCNEPWFYHQEHDGFASPPPAPVKAWIQRVSEWVTDEESRLPRRHLLSVDLTNQGAALAPADLAGWLAHVSVINVHYDANAEILRANPGGPRLLACNETGFNGTADDNYRTQGWNFLLSGGGLYGNLDFSFAVGHEDGTAMPRFTGNYNAGGGPAIRAQLARLLRFMESLPLADMTVQNDVIVGGADLWRALAAPGRAYAVWFPGDGPIAPVVALPTGRWRAEWVDILTGAVSIEEFTQTQWISTLHGLRRGGGAALRIFPADHAAPPGRLGSQADSAVALAPGSDAQADLLLDAIERNATARHITGVAAVGYFDGAVIASWRSRARVVGRLTDPPQNGQPGANLLAIAYAKAAEMAETHRPSGAQARPKMLGELGWQGGLVARGASGYWIVAFSGGKSEDDVALARDALLTLGAGWEILP